VDLNKFRPEPLRTTFTQLLPFALDLKYSPAAIELSRATYRKMIQNLVWATAYNIVAIPVAGGLLVRRGVDLSMSVGAVAMSLSTIIVAANAQLLRRLKPQRAALVT
jgi:cation transport ATPase